MKEIDGKSLLATGFDNATVTVVKSPITERYCRPGDEGTVRNGQIRVGGAWFNFDERWTVVTPTKQTA